jgi:hypothetical protein
LFQEQSKSLREWAKNITSVRENGKSIAAEYGEKLVSAFRTMKDVTSFLLDHWKEIAAIWGSFKLASWTMSPGGAAGGLTSMLGALGPESRAALWECYTLVFKAWPRISTKRSRKD